MAGIVQSAAPVSEWRAIVARYHTPSVRAALIQILNTLLPLAGILVLMVLLLDVSYWLVLLLAVPAGGFVIRTFIIMHDCGHGSFLPSRRWNDIVGFITGVIALTPYAQWRHDHAIHHATSGNLEERGWGDITTISVREYLALSWWRRLAYRIYRNPLVLLGAGPFWLPIKQRWPTPGPKTGAQQIKSVLLTDVAILAILALLAAFGSLDEMVLIYLPVVAMSGATGIFLFYVQHQFEEAYWRPREEWDYATSALQGSTYLRLPRVLQWFTGNIGLHHVHHLSPRIPNYQLQRCHDENPVFHDVPTLTLRASFRTLRLKLWDEQTRHLVGFRAARERRRAERSGNPDAAGGI
jgi:omega-6 fatty acid desaturase (delta-12 desaturase)